MAFKAKRFSYISGGVCEVPTKGPVSTYLPCQKDIDICTNCKYPECIPACELNCRHSEYCLANGAEADEATVSEVRKKMLPKTKKQFGGRNRK